jgi:hypothetical protein
MESRALGVHAPSAGNGDQAVARDISTHLAAADPKTRATIEEWAKKLVDLSRRNRLLNFHPTKRTTLVFRSPSPDAVFNRLADGKAWKFYMPPEIPKALPGAAPQPVASLDEILQVIRPSDAELVCTERDPKEIHRSLEAISRKGRAEFEDRGTHVLHLVQLSVHPEPVGCVLDFRDAHPRPSG